MNDLVSRQEAIEALESNLVKESGDLVKDLVEDSSSDLISRQQAIEAFEPEHRTDWYTPRIIEVLEALPPAQSERKKGKWINHRKDDGHNIADCDQCGNAIQWFDGDEIPRYCCICGADMRGDEMIYPQVDGITSSII